MPEDLQRLEIRKVNISDSDAIWGILSEVVNEGGAISSDESVSKEQALRTWISEDTYVAYLDGEMAGAYRIFPIQIGRGSHIACAAHMVSPKYRGRGIGFALGEHSLKIAKEKGYIAMQFNCVVSTNKPAVELWKKLGFSILGMIPQGFRHKDFGFVDTYIMYRPL